MVQYEDRNQLFWPDWYQKRSGVGTDWNQIHIVLCYNVITNTNWWWHGGSVSVDPLAIGIDVMAVTMVEIWDNYVRRW